MEYVRRVERTGVFANWDGWAQRVPERYTGPGSMPDRHLVAASYLYADDAPGDVLSYDQVHGFASLRTGTSTQVHTMDKSGYRVRHRVFEENGARKLETTKVGQAASAFGRDSAAGATAGEIRGIVP